MYSLNYTFILLFYLFLNAKFSFGIDEEYRVEGPNEVHIVAVKSYLEVRAKDPSNFNLSEDSPVMLKAKAYAVKRFLVPSDESLKLTKNLEELTVGDSGVLQLPAPVGPDAFLTQAAINVQGGTEVMMVEQSHALAVSVNEDIGMGAISKAGALPMGEKGNWVKFAEDKLKSDHRLDHQALLWQLGNSVLEESQIGNSSSVNITSEEEKFSKLKAWVLENGGKIPYADLKFDSERKVMRMYSTEELQEGETFLSIPIKVTLCRITARNVLIKFRGNYLGEQLKKTFEKSEVWGLAIFLLHEWFKEIHGSGSKWGPLVRSLHMRSLSTPVVQALQGTTTIELTKKWTKDADSLKYFSTDVDGPCSLTKGICMTKPNEKTSDARFELHHLRWAYWVVMQNAVRIKHSATGGSFLALVPFVNTLRRQISSNSTSSFDFDGSVNIRTGGNVNENHQINLGVGALNDAEMFMRFFEVPDEFNPYNELKLVLPGTLPANSKFRNCLKDADAARKDECKDGSYRGDSMVWRSKVLTEWRKVMNLPPRLGDIRMWATRLHLYGDSKEEEKLLSSANSLIAGLPVPTDVIPAEEQLMLLGVARDNDEAAIMVSGPRNRPPPQLYSAPDPTEDPEAQRAMEHLASLAAQLQSSILSGIVFENATDIVLNETRLFFQYGVLPQAGLDELDQYLLKKIGMISHCGVDSDMKILPGNITKELMCAMRVHLMNETEIHTFCPQKIKYFEDNCQQVEFMNYTAISMNNELSMIKTFRNSLTNMLNAYTTSLEDDRLILRDKEVLTKNGYVFISAVRLRSREKSLLKSVLGFLDEYEIAVMTGAVEFQIELKVKEREEADRMENDRLEFLTEVQKKAAVREPVAVLSVDLGAENKVNLTVLEGSDITRTIHEFCHKYSIAEKDRYTLERALRARIVNPIPFTLQLGVVVPTGDRKILTIGQGLNETFETFVFCAKYNITSKDKCESVLERVKARLFPNSFERKVLLVLPIDAPDGRNLQV